MPNRLCALTPDALARIDAIARTGSFAAAARELGKVPSALSCGVRQLKDALDVLLFDHSSRQAQFTEAGRELLHDAQLDICVEGVVSQRTALDLVEAFCGVCHGVGPAASEAGASATRRRLEAGRLLQKPTRRGGPVAKLHRAWRAEQGAAGLGRALQWWLAQLESPVTRLALLERHAGLRS